MVFVVAPGGTSPYGGIGRLVSATVRQWYLEDLRPQLRVLDSYGDRLSPLTALYVGGALARIIAGAQRGSIALVHIHMATRGSIARKSIIARMATRLGLPVLLHLHGSRLDSVYAKLPPLGRRWLRSTLAAATRIIVPGTYWRDVVVETVGIDAAAVHVVSNAVAGPAQVTPRASGGTCELLFVGNLTPQKGLPELVAALASPALRPLRWRLRLAGAGDAESVLQRAAAGEIRDRIDVLGWVPEARVHALLCETDVFVLPSHNEGLSVAMLEAMAHGCAVVTTPVGATLDAVRDGESALVVPPRDPAQLAEALRRVITDPALRATLQTAARQRWHDKFQIADHCRRLQTIYSEMCPALMPALPGSAEVQATGRGD